jgi:protein-tyrosine-phosphatase
MAQPYNALFVCTGNSARSILAEAILGRVGAGRFRAFSAGSRPKPEPHRMALSLLRELGYDVSGFRSKSWDEFAAPGAPTLHFVFSVCDNAAGEACPVWPGTPVTAHWGHEDPAAVVGDDERQRRVFLRVHDELEARIRAFVALPLEQLDADELQQRLDAIGSVAGTPAAPSQG